MKLFDSWGKTKATKCNIKCIMYDINEKQKIMNFSWIILFIESNETSEGKK